MQYDLQQQMRSIKQTRERMVQLHQFLRDKLFHYAKEQGLAERREEGEFGKSRRFHPEQSVAAGH